MSYTPQAIGVTCSEILAGRADCDRCLQGPEIELVRDQLSEWKSWIFSALLMFSQTLSSLSLASPVR